MSRLRGSASLGAHKAFFRDPQARKDFVQGRSAMKAQQDRATSHPSQTHLPPPVSNAAPTPNPMGAHVVSRSLDALSALPFGLGKIGSGVRAGLSSQISQQQQIPEQTRGILDNILNRQPSRVGETQFLDQLVNDKFRQGISQTGAGSFPGHSSLDPTIANYLSSIQSDKLNRATDMGFQMPDGLSYYGADRSQADWADIPVHHGIDLVGRLGSSHNAPIPATTSGTVVHVGHDRSRGNYVVVKDNQGYEHLHMHLNSVNVAPNQRINAWDLLGTMGSTGNVTGAHLDYTVFDPQGRAVNPHTWAAGVYYPQEYPQDWGQSQYVDHRMDDPFQAHYSLPWR